MVRLLVDGSEVIDVVRIMEDNLFFCLFIVEFGFNVESDGKFWDS